MRTFPAGRYPASHSTSALYGAFGRLIRFANCRYAPGTPARNCLNHA